MAGPTTALAPDVLDHAAMIGLRRLTVAGYHALHDTTRA